MTEKLVELFEEKADLRPVRRGPPRKSQKAASR